MATRDTLHVEIVTAERELYSGEANLVSAPGTEGRLGILPRHAALLTTLSPGALNIKLGDAEEPIFVSGGFLEVSNNSVIVLADTAELGQGIDQGRAEGARRPAQEERAQAPSDGQCAEPHGPPERARARCRVAELGHQRVG